VRIHQTGLKAGIMRTKEFERKRLASFSVNVGTKCGHGCLYCSTGADPYIPPSREKKLGNAPPPRGRIPKDLDLEGRMRRKLRTKAGRATYGKRKGIVEPVFGQMKFGRGLRQFLLRGLEYVALEWDLWCIGHNLLKLWSSGCRLRTQGA